MCVNHLEKVQGAATSSLFQTPLFQDTWLRVQLVCKVHCSMPVRLGHWQSQTSNVCSGMTEQRNDRAMIRQICSVKLQDTVTTRCNELLARLGIENLDLILKDRRLRWYWHVECSNGAVKTAFDIQVDGKHGPGRPGRPKTTWKQLTERDCREWKLFAINPYDRHTWRSVVRSAMCAASQLPGRGPTAVMLPLYLPINQKSNDDDKVTAWKF